MSLQDEINSAVSSYRTKIAEQEAENARLEEKIERLKTAKDKVYSAYDSAATLRDTCTAYDVSDSWAGDVYSNKYCGYFDLVGKRCINLADSALENYNAIAAMIGTLESRLAEGRGLVFRYNLYIGALSSPFALW